MKNLTFYCIALVFSISFSLNAQLDLSSLQDKNILIVGQGTNHPLLFTNHLAAADINWINGPPESPLQCYAKTRYRQPDQLCWVTPDVNGGCQTVFDQPQRAVTPGQSVVFYQDDLCLGGGVIESTWNSDSNFSSLAEHQEPA